MVTGGGQDPTQDEASRGPATPRTTLQNNGEPEGGAQEQPREADAEEPKGAAGSARGTFAASMASLAAFM